MRRLIAAAALLLICAAAGAVNAERYRLRLRTLETLLGDLAELENSLKFERGDAASTVEKLTERGGLTAFWTALSKGIAANGFKNAYLAAASRLPLGKTERGILDGFMLAFGGGDIGTELSRLALARERLESVFAGQRPRLENRIRLSRTLSALLGAALALTVL